MKKTDVAMFVVCILLGMLSTANAAEELHSREELYEGPQYRRAKTNPEDDPEFPNALIIGDSISIGYTIPVRKLLKEKVDIFRIPDNARDTGYGVSNIDRWLSARQPNTGAIKYDVIHFNWGLWDVCYRHPESTVQGHRDKVRGTLTTTPEQYAENLEKIVVRLKATGARLIWCATTPVPEKEAGRIQGDEIKYNAIAATIMCTHGVQINDLHSHAMEKIESIQSTTNVHFGEAGNDWLATKVAEEILKALNGREQSPIQDKEEDRSEAP